MVQSRGTSNVEMVCSRRRQPPTDEASYRRLAQRARLLGRASGASTGTVPHLSAFDGTANAHRDRWFSREGALS